MLRSIFSPSSIELKAKYKAYGLFLLAHVEGIANPSTLIWDFLGPHFLTYFKKDIENISTLMGGLSIR